MHSSHQQKARRLGKSGCVSFKAIPMGCLKETERSSLEFLNWCLILPFIAVFRPRHLITSLFSQPCNEEILPFQLRWLPDSVFGGEFKALELSSFFILFNVLGLFLTFRWICWKTLKSKESQIVLYEIKRVNVCP